MMEIVVLLLLWGSKGKRVRVVPGMAGPGGNMEMGNYHVVPGSLTARRNLDGRFVLSQARTSNTREVHPWMRTSQAALADGCSQFAVGTGQPGPSPSMPAACWPKGDKRWSLQASNFPPNCVRGHAYTVRQG